MQLPWRDHPWVPEPIDRALRWMSSRGWLPIIALVLAAIGTWAFVGLADEVQEQETTAIDTYLLTAIGGRYDTIGPFWQESGRDLTALGGSTVVSLMVMGVTLFLLLKRQWKVAIFVVVSVLGGLLLSLLLKQLFGRERPDLFAHESHIMTHAFPSGHSSNSDVAYFTMAVLLSKLLASWRLKTYVFIVGLTIPFLVGLSRVFLRVHWPTDVLGGWLIGLSWGLLVWGVVTFLQRRGMIEQEGQIEQERVLQPS